MEDQESTLVEHGPCTACGSSDACASYSDGHTYCFSCQTHTNGNTPTTKEDRPMSTKTPSFSGILGGDYQALAARNIDEITCKKFGYRVVKHNGQWLQVADYRGLDGRAVIGQKIRGADKAFRTSGNFKEVALFGQHLWRTSGKRIVITEGEIDAMSVGQVQDNKWPVVSLPTGAASAKKAITKSIEWLLGFEEIVLMFDDDEPGQRAAEECAQLFPPGRCKIAKINGYKDANAALVDLNAQAVVRAIYEAKDYRPDGILTIGDLKESVLTPPEVGLDWPWPTLTHLTYGRRRGELYFLGAGTGVGKTDVFLQVAAHIEQTEQSPVGAFYLEQSPAETVKRIAGKIARRRFHIPDSGWDQVELSSTLDSMEQNNRMYLYDSFGATDWDVISGHIRYLALAKGVKDVFIDHLTALADVGQDERGSLELITKEMATLAHELHITIYCISHLATPEGKSHEEGGRVTIRQLKGSRSIGFWANFIFGLERDQQHEDEDWRTTTTFRVLKDRYTGNSTGSTFYLGYDKETGILHERLKPGTNEETFADESGDQPF
jgi:twinkle protein